MGRANCRSVRCARRVTGGKSGWSLRAVWFSPKMRDGLGRGTIFRWNRAARYDSNGRSDNILLAAARTGLYISRDAGISWTKAQAGLPGGLADGMLTAAGVLAGFDASGGVVHFA